MTSSTTQTLSASSHPLTTAATALLLMAVALPAQAFSATAAGTLAAYAGPSSQSFGPGPIPPTGAGVGAVFGNPPSWAFANADITTNSLTTDVQVVTLFGGFGASASINLTLSLQAPTGAGVRITITQVENLGVLFGGAVSVNVAGQSYVSSVSGTQVFDALVPAGGLNIQVTHSSSHPADSNLVISWTYPGVVFAGAPTPGCLGPAVCWTQGIPELGNSSFGFTCANAHPGFGGVVAIGLGGVSVPWVYDYVNIWLDPNLPIVTNYIPASATGDILHPLPIPTHPSFAGLDLFTQWVLLEPPGCMPLGLSGSNAVRVTLLP